MIRNINDKLLKEILDLSVSNFKEENDKKNNDESVFSRILDSFKYLNKEKYEEYKRILKNSKIKLSLTDKKNVINYLKNNCDKPFCIRNKKEKNDSVRKIIKFKEDNFVKKYRIIPDDEFINESFGKRKILDSFDKMNNKEKIIWARHARLALSGSFLNKNKQMKISDIRDDIDVYNLSLAMKYACKMSRKPIFQGRFAESYWILYRIKKYEDIMTDEEFGTYMKLKKSFANSKFRIGEKNGIHKRVS